ncbi:proteoglycan 4b [Anableps anableps]
MSSKTLMVVTLLVCALKFISSQTSCRGRCGAEYDRGNMCQCDYTCLSYDECCRDFESQCTTRNSCRGRCGETFKRGRRCSCDPECSKFKQCCPDYKNHCDVDESALTEDSSFGEGNNADDNVFTPDSSTPYPLTDVGDDIFAEIFPSDDPSTNGVGDPEASPGPEISSGDGLTPVGPLDEIPTEPALVRGDPEFGTEKNLSVTESTPVDDIFTPTTTAGSDRQDPTRDPDQATALPEAITLEDSSIDDLSSSSAPQIEFTASPDAIETEKEVSPSDQPEIRPTNTQDLIEELENVQLTTTPASSTLASDIPPEETTSSPNIESGPESITTSSPDVPQDVKDPISTLAPAGDEFPSSTATSPDNTSDSVQPDVTAADPPTSGPDPKPDPSKASPTSKPETKPLDPQTQITDNLRDYQGDDSDETNLCSGRPVSGVTTLRNGTMVVFRGHYFWFLDRNLVPNPPKRITEVWGVPSPIDMVFTRCNCQGKTYIFKGGKYWRFENDALDPGYPKIVKMGFDGLQGHITAALSVPQYLNRKESVYFFKRGGTVQKYSYQFGTSPTCGRTAQIPVYTVRTRMVRQAASVLEPEINIRKSWRGFPSTITAAVSVPTNRDPEGYKYIVFSRKTAYNVRMQAERPVVAAPRANVSPKTDNFFRCPKKS